MLTNQIHCDTCSNEGTKIGKFLFIHPDRIRVGQDNISQSFQEVWVDKGGHLEVNQSFRGKFGKEIVYFLQSVKFILVVVSKTLK